jgi:hypothetical protein
LPDTPHDIRIDLQEADARLHTARDMLAALSAAQPAPSGVWRILDAALLDASVLIAEIGWLRADLSSVRRLYADLLAAARATLTADNDAEVDPLFYLRDELGASGELPPDTWRRA